MRFKESAGKIVLFAGAALRKSFFCPRLVLCLPPFAHFVAFTTSLCDTLVMSQAYPRVRLCDIGVALSAEAEIG